MTEVEYRNSLYEISEILKILDRNLVFKIPKNVIDMIENEKSEDYSFQLDYSKKLSEQKISKTTELFLTALDLKYWCNEEEKQQISNAMVENEKKYQKELKEKYNPENIFRNRNDSLNNNIQQQETAQSIQMIEYKKESLFKKIVNKLKGLIKN